ncbi:MAG: dephospho-CoA kinase [Clostridia bacterium]
MKIIGLTGGIGTGKSTVSAYLAQKGCKIIDADLISHQMTEAGSPCLAEIKAAFGEDVFLRDGNLDRKKVGRLVFADATKKKTLEQIITRRVIEKTLRILQDCRAQQEDLVVLDAPLLFECGMQRYTDETWLVVCRTETRLRRIAARDGLAEEDIQKRIANQMSTEQKEKLADYIIDNSRDLAWLYAQIDTLLAKSEQREKNG